MYIRNCKKCGKEVIHKDEKNYNRALKENKICVSCSSKIKSSGENNAMFGKTHSNETKQKIKEKRKLQTFSVEDIEKMSIAGKKRCEEYNHWLGRKHKSETIDKLRVIHSKKIINNKWHPSFNIEACKVIENYGKKYGYNFLHAMNGGEYFISELGYWVDGYDVEKNTVIEYYEKGHKYYIEKDAIRIQNIKNHLKCDIIILREWNDDDISLINELKL
jgi:hypothetical protein